jgi:hypothetical protein
MAVIVLIIIAIINIINGTRGTYQDHTDFIKQLISIPYENGGQYTQKPQESSGEAECRRVAEKITGYKFPKQRPDFLRNSVTNANLEIDCFCKELGIGIEYNGRQHYEYVPHFHATREAFHNIKYRDEMKRRLCSENGIRLIIVPYTVPIRDIEQYITDRIGNYA